MGYNVEDYEGTVNPAILCSVCKEVLKDPVNTPCGHTFCRECIIEWIRTSPSCPVDRNRLNLENISNAGCTLRSLLDSLPVKCGFSVNGCSYSGKRSSLVNHESGCRFNPTIVCDKGCGLTIQRSEFQNHCCLQSLKSLLQEKTVALAESETRKDTIQRELESRIEDLNQEVETLETECDILESDLEIALEENLKLRNTRIGDLIQENGSVQ
jgi:E3 ubiquitin-protein ligase NRDP1